MGKLSAAELKQLLRYEPDTGHFYWLVKRGRPGIGTRAGADNGTGYLQICINYKMHYAHRLAHLYMTGVWPEHQIDHINRDRSDNRWSNLRPATREQNMCNRDHDPQKGYRGVRHLKRRRKWCAAIQHKGKRVRLGYFDHAAAAARAYDLAAIKFHGEFATTNKSLGLL